MQKDNIKMHYNDLLIEFIWKVCNLDHKI